MPERLQSPERGTSPDRCVWENIGTLSSDSPTFVPRAEAERLRTLLAYEVLDTAPDPAMNEIARLAAQIAGAPYAYIGFIDAVRVWFKAHVGFSERQVPRSLSACQFAMLGAHPLIVRDAAHDDRFPDRHIPIAED